MGPIVGADFYAVYPQLFWTPIAMHRERWALILYQVHSTAYLVQYRTGAGKTSEHYEESHVEIYRKAKKLGSRLL